MGFFGDMSCKVGIHDWSNWFYENVSNCKQVKKCNRCGKLNAEKRTEHSFGGWGYPNDGACRNIRTCSRCTHVEERILHSQSGWAYDREGHCSQHRTCSRCANVENRKEHTWDSWHYDGPKSCDQLRICAVCHERETRIVSKDEDHERWSEWDYASLYNCGMFERHCLRCNREQTRVGLPQHKYSEWEQTSRTRMERRCVRCHNRDWKTVETSRY